MKKILLSLALLLVSSGAQAQSPEWLRPGSHPFWASFAVGPAMAVRDGRVTFWGFSATYPTPTQAKLAENFGYHFLGEASGPAISLELQESFGDSHFIFEAQPRFSWDIQLLEQWGWYVTPSLGVGYLFGAANECSGCTANGLTVQLGLATKVVIADRFLVSLRGFNLDITPVNANYWGIDTWMTPIRYDLLFALGATF